MIRYLNSKSGFISIAFLTILLPKVYFLIASHENKFYTTEKAYSNGDASHYLRIAKNIHDFGVFSDNNSEIPNISATWRPPAWPFILSLLFYFCNSLFGLIIAKSVLEVLLLIVALSWIKRFKKNKCFTIFLVFYAFY